MELNGKNINRLIRYHQYRLKRNWKDICLKILAWIYLLSAFCIFANCFSYNIIIADKPLGYFIVVIKAVGYYALFVLVNHLLVGKIISHQILFVIEILAVLMLFSLLLTDARLENCLSF